MDQVQPLTDAQRWYQRLKADPVRHAKWKAQMRIASAAFRKTAHRKEYNRKYQRSEKCKARRNANARGKSGPQQMKRYYANPQVKLRVLASVYISRCVTIYGAKKTKNTMRYVGCSKAQLVAHIEKQFEKGMTWENYGQWEIDHIHPLSKWDLTDPMQMGLANHFTNLRPLWKGQNAAKSNHITEDWQMPLGT